MGPGFYDRHFLPHLVNVTCGSSLTMPLRNRVCVGLHGHVVELGFGSGHNVGAYPDAVTEVSAVEPSDAAWRLGADRIASSSAPVIRAGLDGQSLPFADNTFDAALSTFTMCTIPDLPAAIAELRRVLKAGAPVRFLEHGRAPDESVRRWQHRLEPMQRRIAGGCHLTRDIPAAIADAGFEITDLDRFYQPGTPKFFGALSLGGARAT
ncbi:class I SAM-dependent methyltransferase [Gordonia sp. DT30]|uniref:class I SAM-dependent methyltransferase n=1 Tax=Gordonia sp. DT30 TaxID=3416546 RepID=UPI003CF36D90